MPQDYGPDDDDSLYNLLVGASMAAVAHLHALTLLPAGGSLSRRWATRGLHVRGVAALGTPHMSSSLATLCSAQVANFEDALTGNRAPLPLFIHTPWFTERRLAQLKAFAGEWGVGDLHAVTPGSMCRSCDLQWQPVAVECKK